MSIFETEDPFPGAIGQTRRALQNMDREAFWYKKMKAVVEGLGVPVKVPFWKPDAWAHVGFPNHGMVIVIAYQMSWVVDRGFRPKWAKHGFRVSGVTSDMVGRMSPEDLKEAVLRLLENKEQPK